MNITALAAHRAACAAELETLTSLEPKGDREENAAHLRAQALARAAYRDAEQALQSALSTLSAAEIAELGGPQA